MKTTRLFSILAAVALSLISCGPEVGEAVTVDFDVTQQDFEASIASIELMPLQRDSLLRLGYAPSLYTSDGDWFLVERDPTAEKDFRNYKLYRYDSKGRFLNAIGQKGKRLDEIFLIDNIQFRDASIIVFSREPQGGGEKAITYDYEGNVLGAKHFEFADGQSLLLKDGVLTYYGHGDRHGKEGRLMLYSEEGVQRKAFLTERTASMNFKSNSDVLLPTGRGVIVFDTFSNKLWCYNAGKLKPFLEFDLGDYTIDDEFFAIKDRGESYRHLSARQYAMIHRYAENEEARLVEVPVHTADKKRFCLYGFDSGNGWRWFRSEAPFEGTIQLLDGKQAIALVEPAQLLSMNETLRGRLKNPEVLEGMVPEDNYVIARITFTE